MFEQVGRRIKLKKEGKNRHPISQYQAYFHKGASINDVRFGGDGGYEMTPKIRLKGKNRTLGEHGESKIVKNRRTSFMNDP